MENYTKGEVKEVELQPVFVLDNSGIEMRVNAGSKIRNLLGYSMKKMKEPGIKQISWNGSGNAITKTISCAEIMKRKFKDLHQITKIRNRRIEEYWEPKIEGLERLKVNRDIPAVSILLSKDPLNTEEPGYQPPGSFDAFWKSVVQQSKTRTGNSGKRRPQPHTRPVNSARGHVSDKKPKNYVKSQKKMKESGEEKT